MSFKKIFAAALVSSAVFSANAFEDSIGGERDVFSVFDANQDGKISMTEVVEAMMRVVKMDKDGDHFISIQELQHQEDYSHWMAIFDFNKDGRLSATEIPQTMHDSMHKMDANKDGFLSIEELTGEADVFSK